MLVYDLEILKQDWLVGTYDGKNYVQIHNDYDELVDFYQKHLDEIWVGHNSSNYDSVVLKCILLHKTPEQIKSISDEIINDGKVKEIIRRYHLSKIQLYDWDILSNKVLFGLKEAEGYMGLEISESSVDFSLNDKLTPEQYEDLALYNRHDLYATWLEAIDQTKAIKTRLMLLRRYNLPKYMISYTNAKVTAEILESDYKTYNDTHQPFDTSIIPLEIKKYTECVDFFTKCDELDYKRNLKIDLAGVPHVLAIGGIHGAIPNFHFKGEMWLIDVASYYPNMMINFGLTPRSIKQPEMFKALIDERIEAKHKVSRYKAEGREKELTDLDVFLPIALKLPINTVSGCMKSKFSKLYDEKHNNWMCISGQLLMVDLIEHLEPYCKLIQSNTDGIMIIPINHKACDEQIQHWMDKTGLVLEKTVATYLLQKDVNNYILLDDEGHVKVKGSYVAQYYNDQWLWNFKQNNDICDKAIVDYVLYDTPLLETIDNDKNKLVRYQLIKKIGGMYSGAYLEEYNNIIPLKNRCNRIFPAKDKQRYGKLKKKKWNKETLDNVEGLPEHCLVVNENIQNITLGDFKDKIDLNWYVDLCKKRIIDYVLENKERTKGKNYSFDIDWQTCKKKLGKL